MPDNCDRCFHTRCYTIGDQTYETLGTSSCVWICCDCNTANDSSVSCNSLLDLFNSPGFYSPLAAQAETTLHTNKPKDQATRQREYPCGICNRSVSWRQKGIRCENSNCQQWYYIGCQNMCSVEHEQELNKDTWKCSECPLPNHSTTLFDLHSSPTNSADSLLISTRDGDDRNNPLLSLGSPLASSSPTQIHHNLQTIAPNGKPTRILSINCQSALKNSEAFASILDSIGCDIVTGTESWLTKDNEIFPPGYTIYRIDRETGQRGDGVFIAINKDLVSTNLKSKIQICRNAM